MVVCGWLLDFNFILLLSLFVYAGKYTVHCTLYSVNVLVVVCPVYPRSLPKFFPSFFNTECHQIYIYNVFIYIIYIYLYYYFVRFWAELVSREAPVVLGNAIADSKISQWIVIITTLYIIYIIMHYYVQWKTQKCILLELETTYMGMQSSSRGCNTFYQFFWLKKQPNILKTWWFTVSLLSVFLLQF